eukprot:8170626-Alexandrium_andersonii.AAC.1
MCVPSLASSCSAWRGMVYMLAFNLLVAYVHHSAGRHTCVRLHPPLCVALYEHSVAVGSGLGPENSVRACVRAWVCACVVACVRACVCA